MTPAQAAALLDAVIESRKTSRTLAIAEGHEISEAIEDDDAAMATVFKMIAKLTK